MQWPKVLVLGPAGRDFTLPPTALTWPKTGDGDEPVAVAGVNADLCLSWPALGTVSEGWAAHASQLSVSGFSFVLVGHLEGNIGHHEKQVLPTRPLLTHGTQRPTAFMGLSKFTNKTGWKEVPTRVRVRASRPSDEPQANESVSLNLHSLVDKMEQYSATLSFVKTTVQPAKKKLDSTCENRPAWQLALNALCPLQPTAKSRPHVWPPG